MTTAIQFLRSNVPGLRPNPLTLSDGMPMINYNLNDPGLYFKSTDDTLLKIGPTHYGAKPPNTNPAGFGGLGKGEMWMDTSVSPRGVLKIWSGAAWVAAGGEILQEEVPQAKNTFLGGPVTGADALPTFRRLENEDIPDDLDYHKFAGGDVEGGLLIGGGTPGWEVATLTMGPGMTQTVGPNSITLEVTAGDIAADGSPGVNFANGDGHVQLNYGGKFTGDARFKFINKDNPSAEDKLIAHVSTELGLDPLTHTHIIKGDTTLHGDLELTDVYSIDAGGDLTIGHNATFGASAADQFKVYGVSSFYQDVTLENLSSMLIGGNLTVTNNTDLGTGDNNTHNITGEINLLGDTTIGRLCGDAVLIKGSTSFECDVTLQSDLLIEGDLTVLGNTDLGSSCTDFITVHGEQHNLCDILIGENVPAANAEMIKIEAATGDITTEGTVNIKEELVVSNPLANRNFVVDAATGDATSVGTITAAYFVGDGSQLYNLAVPNAMLFHGDIDATSTAAPANPIAGDFWLNNTTGTVVAGWPDIGGTPIQQDQFIYFYDDGQGGKWAKGSVQNQQGFVTINTNQDINGTKTFTVHQQFNSTITVEDHTQLNDTLQVEGATLLNNTLTVAPSYATDLGGTLTVAGHTQLNNTLTVADNKATVLGGTLQVKKATQLDDTLTVTGHTQLNNTLTVADGKLTTLGGDLNAKGDITLGTDCFNTITLNGETAFKCAVEIGDSNNPCTTGNFLVYSPSYFYCPVEITNTLTVLGDFLTELGGDLIVEGDTRLKGTLTVDPNQATLLGGTLTVADDKATVLGGTLLVKDSTLLDDTLTVTSATQLNDTLTVADNKATVLGGTLQVKKAATFNDTLQVDDTKASTLGGTLLVKEKTTLFATKNCAADALEVNGKSVFQCNVTINADLGITGDITGDGDLTLGGDVELGTSCTNTLLIKSTTTINCATEILNTLDVTGDYTTTLGGKLHVVGNTALGTTNASEKLEVNGNIGIARTAGGYFFLETTNGDRRAGMVSNAANDLQFKTGNQSTRMTILGTNGNVGLDETNPDARLKIGGTATAGIPAIDASSYGANKDDTSDVVLSPNSVIASQDSITMKVVDGFFAVRTNGGTVKNGWIGASEKMRLTNDGRLGIGTQTPSSGLMLGDHVGGAHNQDSYITFGKRHTSTTEGNFPYIGQSGYDNGNADLGLGTRSTNGAIRLYTGNSGGVFHSSHEKVTILPSGNVGINTTNALQKLHVSTGNNSDSSSVAIALGGTVNNGRQAIIKKDNVSGSVRPLQFFSSPNNTGERLEFYPAANNQAMTIATNGKVGINFTSPNVQLVVKNSDQTGNAYCLDLVADALGQSPIYRMVGRNIANNGQSSFDIIKVTASGTKLRNTDTHANNFTSFDIGAKSNVIYMKSDSKVGINTNNPLAQLDVNGEGAIARPTDFWATSTSYFGISGKGSLTTQGNYEVHLTSNGYRVANDKWKSLGANGGTGAAQIALNPGGYISFNTEANKANGSANAVTRRMTIANTGKVGIGETNPQKHLDIKASGAELRLNSTSSTYSRFTHSHNGAAKWTVGTRTDDNYYIYREAGNSKHVLIHGGRLGVLEGNPAVALHVGGEARSNTSTTNSSHDKTLVTKDYITSTIANGGGQFGYWTRNATSSTLSMVNTADTLSLGGQLHIASTFKVNTDKFVVTGSNGNTTTKGTLSCAGNFKVNTNKFEVAAGSGNTSIAGTLGVTGAATLSSTLDVTGNFKVNTNKFSVTASNGNTSIAGTLGVTGATTLNSTLAVKNTTTARHIYAEAHNTYNIGQDATRFKNLFLTAAMKSGTITTSGNGSIGAKLEVKSNAADALTVTGKARSASTVSTDVATTLVTKDYLDSQVGAVSGTLKAEQTGGNNNHPNLRLNVGSSTSAVQLIGGTAIATTRNADTQITFDFNGTLKSIQSTGGNNANPKIELQSNATAKSVTITGGTGIDTARSSDSNININNKVQIKCLQTGGNNTDPYISLADTNGASKNVQVVGGTGITSTRNDNAKLTLGFNGYLIAEGTAGNNTNPTISLGGTDNAARKVKVVGGTGTQVDRNTNDQITITSANTLKAVQTGGNNANPNLQISSNQSAKNVQLNGGTGITINRTADNAITFTLDSSAIPSGSPWEVNAGNIRPAAANQNVVPRTDGNVDIGTASLRFNQIRAKTRFIGSGGDAANAPTYTWAGQEAKTGMYLAADNSLGLATSGQQGMRMYPDGSTTWRSNLQPSSDGGANLGSTTLRWANVYTQDMHFSNEGTEGNSVDGTTGNWTLQEGHDHLYFINNKTGVKFRVVMEQV